MSKGKNTEKKNSEFVAAKESNKNPYLMPGAIVIAGVCIAFAIVSSKGDGNISAPVQSEIKAEVMAISDSDHLYGPKDPDVYLIVYSDYRCGYCGVFYKTLGNVVEEYNGRVAWVYRHTPYQNGGKEAAVASECIAEQLGEEAFWAYTASAFENQREISDAWSKDKALELGADGDKYGECISSGKFDDLIAQSTMNAQELGGQGTPFNVLLTKDGGIKKFSGAQPIENVRIFLNQALKSLN